MSGMKKNVKKIYKHIIMKFRRKHIIPDHLEVTVSLNIKDGNISVGKTEVIKSFIQVKILSLWISIKKYYIHVPKND